jgi:pyruvate-formate lyase-activating enzyme
LTVVIDDKKNIADTAQFVSQLNGEYGMELIPYHRPGISKYCALSKNYLLSDLTSPAEDHWHKFKILIDLYGVEAQIKG